VGGAKWSGGTNVGCLRGGEGGSPPPPPPAPRARIGGLFTPLAVNRPDDLFSSDFTDEQLAAARPHPHQR